MAQPLAKTQDPLLTLTLCAAEPENYKLALTVPAGAHIGFKKGRSVFKAKCAAQRVPPTGVALVELLGGATHRFDYRVYPPSADGGRTPCGDADSPRWVQLNPTAEPYVVQLQLARLPAPPGAESPGADGIVQFAVQVAPPPSSTPAANANQSDLERVLAI